MTTITSQIDPQTVQAAQEAAVFVDRSNLGVLKFSGATRLDLVHRMSTQAVNGMKSGEGRATVLTSDIGRIIDRIILYASSDSVYVLTGENNGDAIARYLMRYVFFNDDFQVEDLSGKTAVFGVYGAKAGNKLSTAGFPEVDFPLHHWRQAEISGVTAYLHRTDPVAGDGYLVLGGMADGPVLQQALAKAGIVAMDEAAFDYLRIESISKRFGHELTPDYIPLEADLWDDISFSKGCYIGQEIIARMESRGRLAKKVVKLYPAAPVAVGAEIQANGRRAGSITSAAVGPEGAVALGYVKTAVLAAGAALLVGETAVLRLVDPNPEH